MGAPECDEIKLPSRNSHPPLPHRWSPRPTSNPAHSSTHSRHFHPLAVVHVFHLDINTNHTVGSELVCLELHAAQRQFARLVHQLRVFLEFALEVRFDTHEPVLDCAH